MSTNDGWSKPIILYLIAALVITGIVVRFSVGISGNDFWWHIKVGEWIVQNHDVPDIGIFSWYAIENDLKWISHEWLSEVLLFLTHSLFGNLGIFILSLVSCICMILCIVIVNREKIIDSLVVSGPYLLLSTIILPLFFFGRPQIFSVYLFFLTILCLYLYEQRNSRLVFLIPVISVFWSNIHGGSSNLSYILCLIFIFAGLFDFSFTHLESHKHDRLQRITLLAVAAASFLAITINPHGIEMLSYPYVNMTDSLMLSFIEEWKSPDAKNISDIITCFVPIIFVSLTLLLTSKKIKLVDLLLFLFFAYLAFRSIRFILLFYIATSFFVFDYMSVNHIYGQISKNAKAIIIVMIIFLLSVNIYSLEKISNLYIKNQLITSSLNDNFIDVLHKDKPTRLFNDYDYSDSLIFNDIQTFFDARADIFSSHNLTDACALLYLRVPRNSNITSSIDTFDIEATIAKYSFDAFLIKSNRSLATYLSSHPDKYILILSDENTAYYKVVKVE